MLCKLHFLLDEKFDVDGSKIGLFLMADQNAYFRIRLDDKLFPRNF